MKPGKVRSIAIGVFKHNEAIFVAEGYDEVKQQTFYRPLGGTIEFGERSDQTLTREMREEIGVEISNLRYLGALENIFVYNGQTGHEIILVYDGEFVDRSIYDRPVVEAQEDNGVDFKAVWKPLRDFVGNSNTPLYPTGLLELLLKQE